MARPEDALERTLQENAAEAWGLIRQANTYVYLAGIDRLSPALDRVMSRAANDTALWEETKQKMLAEKRWSELLYS